MVVAIFFEVNGRIAILYHCIANLTIYLLGSQMRDALTAI